MVPSPEVQRARYEELKTKVEAFLAKCNEKGDCMYVAILGLAPARVNTKAVDIENKLDHYHRHWYCRTQGCHDHPPPSAYDLSLVPLYNRFETAQAAAGLRRVADGHGGGGSWQTIMFPFNTQGMTGAQMIDRKMELHEAHKKVLWEMNRALAELYTGPDKEQIIADVEEEQSWQAEIADMRADVTDYQSLKALLRT